MLIDDAGYSWLSNQHGLTIDTVMAFDLVLPTGEIKVVTASSDPDLFFALKGGGNNFVSQTSSLARIRLFTVD